MSFKFNLEKARENRLTKSQIAKLLDPINEKEEMRNKLIKPINSLDVKHYIEHQININQIVSFDDSEINLSDLKKANRVQLYGEKLEDEISKYLQVPCLIEHTGFMEYKNHVPYDDFVDLNQTNFDMLSFTDYFVPLLINHKKCILSRYSGQGESFVSIETLEHLISNDNRYTTFNKISKYYNLDDILK